MKVFPAKAGNKMMENTTLLLILKAKGASKLSHCWLDNQLLEFVDMAYHRERSLWPILSETFAGSTTC